MKINRIRRYDQVTKLRECLRSNPKKLIPQTMEDIDEAWKVLTIAFGDPTRVMAARKRKLMDLGQFPPNGKDADALRKQVEWLITLETTLGDIMELAESNLDMEYEAYNGVMVRTIRQLFHVEMVDNLTFRGTAQFKVTKMKEFAADLRETKQELLKDHEGAESSHGGGGSHGGAGNGGRTYGGGGIHGGGRGNGSNRRSPRDIIPEAAVTFPTAQRHEQCRICNQLNVEGDTTDLYDGHTSDMAQGCPRFIKMGQQKRFDIAKNAKLCLDCLDADYVFRPNVYHKDCLARADGEKKGFSCNSSKPDCRKHFLICRQHQTLNKKKMDRTKEKWSKKGVTFSYNVSSKPTRPDIPVTDPTNQEGEVFESTEGIAHCNNKAAEHLKDLAKGSTVLEVPEGEPLFLFSCAVGKTRSIKIFYDGGCSHVVIKDEIPDKELPGTMTKKGPLQINGVGNTKITVGDEWSCLLDLVDGTKQTIQGVTVDKITSKFPRIKLKEATAEIKASDPNNRKLQKLRVPDEVGGDADILLGTLYNAIFPVIIHTLPCGLFIAKLKVASPGNKWTGVIGGPHRSFQALLEQTGSPSYLMAHFVDGSKDL